MAAITLRQLDKHFGKTDVIKHIDLEIADKEFVVFVGPSGCGKSTLLRLIAGLEDPSNGDILFDGTTVNDLKPAERGIAMVFQSYALYPHMNVYQNMAFGLKLAKLGKAGIDERVRKAAGILQIEHLLERKPKELSGGQRQRVAIGRAIVRQPRVFLFDEPLSNLDAALRVQMRIEIAKLHRELDATMIYVTHDQVEAMTLASRIVVLNGGRIEQCGAPLELYHHPANLFVAGFIGSPQMNFLAATIAAVGDREITIELANGLHLPVAVPDMRNAAIGQSLTLGLRPEHLQVDGSGIASLSGRIMAVEHLGSESYLYVEQAGGAPLVVKSPGSSGAGVGERISVGIPAHACHFFDAGGVAVFGPN
ncbi:MAG: sn-glycerol-3-phosphate ABC transporter ATP-binding protein UgpC [Gammaproteobacteria bacterium]|nr:sn-glycerol-3-phosphate ABC transporter ATP-binding protein UgpC [Gammaproteobacteria bacterium]MBU1603159.1 sn-glycerol-3-phosphate ABC transporter ATP-binding protein UgpC [Gammaproteobacteria bacterium]MBU2432679.1 sn-glycerol-3-phosphate ABC transporter ATP-binding protein UgpC [Gammaproteobacteria bacterium]MBU2451510.1 sn-glycerol-3-phosphate ABC transporter ATP-binding protein UgpC [Gammaproteobacteria bacterium]